ncbi:TPR repeat-containing protein DDB_G0287407 [Lingula anatina]|uniref:TPR repeat-containing protein DDB_G0287407 n=1 Tax=Lingula anatina TaxID=7574 RepID=A0A1S3H763_LINAN|nr:TPR repeat-containing protein DDB_G0287407 [Lingula anatina]|eukprot:XP_013381321.1 TPR repeat-containing protein DDB_G0287407 [Lingula anatina]
MGSGTSKKSAPVKQQSPPSEQTQNGLVSRNTVHVEEHVERGHGQTATDGHGKTQLVDGETELTIEDIEHAWNKVDETAKKSENDKSPHSKKLVSGWREIRIFISSTFTDMQAERDVLLKEVFPELREWCQERKLDLIDIDLRWGVPKGASSEEILKACLGEIDRCYDMNDMPYFINMTGHKIGWIPDMEEVPEHLVDEYEWIFKLSVTEMEIVHGAYRKKNPNALFLVREDPIYEAHMSGKELGRFKEVNNNRPVKREKLLKMLQRQFPETIMSYKCYLLSGKNGLEIQVDNFFKDAVMKFFKKRIDEHYPLNRGADVSPLARVRETHEAFMETKSEYVLGRDSIIKQILDYVRTDGVSAPLVVVGPAGMGKSSVMAKAAQELSFEAEKTEQSDNVQQKLKSKSGEDIALFYHFVGAVPDSTDLLLLIERLLAELGITPDNDAMKDLDSACNMCRSILASPDTKPAVIFIDAVNQLTICPPALNMDFLPGMLSPNVKCVVSVTEDSPHLQSLRKMGTQMKEIKVTPLSDKKIKEEIVTTYLQKYNKKLNQAHTELIINKKYSENPLWLTVALEELRVFGFFSKLENKINDLADGLEPLLNQVLERYEAEAGAEMLKCTLCLIEASASGLKESELRRLLAFVIPPTVGKDDGWFAVGPEDPTPGYISPFKWAVVYRHLRSFLRPYGNRGEGRLDFYHRSLSKVVRDRYMQSEQHLKWWHEKLELFFTNSDVLDRKVEELPHHLIFLQKTTKLAEFLTDWQVFDKLYNEEWSSTLLQYWQKAENAGDTGGTDGQANVAGVDAKEEAKRKKQAAIEAKLAAIKAKSLDTPNLASNQNEAKVVNMMKKYYLASLQKMEKDGVGKEDLARRQEQVARLFFQAGLYDDSLALAEKARMLEEQSLGGRPGQLSNLLSLKAQLLYQKLGDHINTVQSDSVWTILENAFRAVEVREQSIQDKADKIKCAQYKLQSAMYLSHWIQLGGGNQMTKEDARKKGTEYVDEVMKVFEECNDFGRQAEAMMMKAVMAEPGTRDQLELYKQALDKCQRSYGECSPLGARINSNIAAFYEDVDQYTKAYGHFKKAKDTLEDLYGPKHPKAVQLQEILDGERYQYIAKKVAGEKA